MSFRFIHSELHNCGVLGPSRSFEWSPGLNLVVGDRNSGKTTLVRALIAAFCGLPPGDLAMLSTHGLKEAARVQLRFQTRHEVMEVNSNWQVPNVDLVALPSMGKIFHGPSWSGLLPTLERHARGTGLARTLSLSVEPMSLTLPPAIFDLFIALHGSTESRQPEELSRERSRVQHQQAELVRQRATVLKRQEKLFALRQRIAEHFSRYITVDEEFPIQILCLSLARGDLRRFREEEDTRQETLSALRQSLEAAQAALRERYPSYVDLGMDYPRQLARFKELELVLAQRHTAVEALQQRVRLLDQTLQPYQARFEPRPADFQVRLTAIVAMEGSAMEQLSRLESAAKTVDDVSQSLKATRDSLARLHRYEAVPEDYPQQIAALSKARRDMAEQRERIEAIDEKLSAAQRSGSQYDVAARWPEDFPERLARLRSEQRVCETRAAELSEQKGTIQKLRVERAELQKQLEAFERLEREGDNFPERLASLLVARQELVEETAALTLVQQRLTSLNETLESEYGALAAFGDTYCDQLEQLRHALERVGQQKDLAGAGISSRRELDSELEMLQTRLSTEFPDLAPMGEDFPGQLKEYHRLTAVQRDLEGRRADIQAQIAVLEDHIEAEFPQLSHVESPVQGRLESLRTWDEFRRELLLRLDWELLERREAEAQLQTVEVEAANLSLWSHLPDGFPVLLAVQNDVRHARENQDELLADLDRQQSDLHVDEDTGARLQAFQTQWLQHLVRRKEAEVAAARVEAAQADVRALKQQVASLAPPGVDLAAYRLKQQELQTLRDTVNPRGRGRRSTGKLSLFGSGEGTANRKLQMAEDSLSQLLDSWNLAEGFDLAGALEQDRIANDKLAAALARLGASQSALEQARDEESDAALQEEATQLHLGNIQDPATVEAEWRKLQERVQSLLVIKTRRRQVARTIEILSQLTRPVPGTKDRTKALDAYERLRNLEQQRAVLHIRLSLLRPVQELESQRRELLLIIAEGLEDLAGGEGAEREQRLRRYLEFQHLQAEIARLTRAREQIGRRSGHDDVEQIAQQRATLETRLGGLADSELEPTLARFEACRTIQERIAEIQRSLTSLPTQTQLKDSLEAAVRAADEGMERLQVGSEEGITAALERYHAYRALVAERDGLDTVLRTRWHALADDTGHMETDVDRLRMRVASMEQALSPWATKVETLAQAQALGARYREARATSEALQKVEAEAATVAVLEENIRRLEEETRATCVSMGVPEGDGEDAELLRQWRSAAEWRVQYKVLQEEREQCLQAEERPDGTLATILDRLQEQVDRLEQALQILPTEDPELVLRAFRRYLTLKTRHDELLARSDSLGLAPDVSTEKQRIRDKIQTALADLGLPSETSAAATFKAYQEYRKVQKEHKGAQADLQAALQGRGPDDSLAELERELEELRPRLGGHDSVKDVNAELTQFADFQRESRNCTEVQTRLRAVEEDVRLQTQLRETEELITEKEGQVGDWIHSRDPDEVLSEYQEYLKLKGQMAEQEEALKGLPSTAELALRLEGAARLLTEIDAFLDSTDGMGGTHLGRSRAQLAKLANRVEGQQAADQRSTLERCASRASGLLRQLSGGRLDGLRVDNGSARLLRQGKEMPVGDSGGLARQVELCWRLAVCLELQHCYPWPLLLDDPFVELDSDGRSGLVSILKETAAHRQVIVLTRERALDLVVTADLNAAVVPVEVELERMPDVPESAGEPEGEALMEGTGGSAADAELSTQTDSEGEAADSLPMPESHPDERTDEPLAPAPGDSDGGHLAVGAAPAGD